ncbi:hypothetical protein VTJ04DRAFT_2550 [Mycothermus thermophilus]|uniref:uncharacterized protein n=1 Tax=Humicola insolens TaxID=85995 RepID=UPI003741F393
MHSFVSRMDWAQRFRRGKWNTVEKYRAFIWPVRNELSATHFFPDQPNAATLSRFGHFASSSSLASQTSRHQPTTDRVTDLWKGHPSYPIFIFRSSSRHLIFSCTRYLGIDFARNRTDRPTR